MILTEQLFYVCHNGGSVIQFFDLTSGGKLYNALEFVETFSNLEDAIARINELGNSENYFEDHFSIKLPQPPTN